MRKFAFAAAVSTLALAQPVVAQDEGAEEPVYVVNPEFSENDGSEFEDEGDGEMDAAALAMITGILGAMFEADPLTPEAEARLPAATSVAASLVPEGVYGEMMGQMMDSFLSPILKLAEADGGGMSASDLTEYTGLYGEDLESLSPEQRVELTEIFDPVYETRSKAQLDMIVGTANAVFATLEPGVRDGLAKAYASRFEESELTALNAFFATPVGAKYASQSLVINTDPQVISGMIQSIPNLLEQMPAVLEAIESAEAGLPEPRRYDDLTPAEQRRASEILGVEQTELRESMAAAEMMEAEADAMGDEMEDWSDEAMEQAVEDAAAEVEEAAE